MLGSKYPDELDAFALPTGETYLASEMLNQLAEMLENTERAFGQGLGDQTSIGNPDLDTVAKFWKARFRMDFGSFDYTASTGQLITAQNLTAIPPIYGTREKIVVFNTYGGYSIFDDASKIRVFVVEQGGSIRSQTANLAGSTTRGWIDSGNVVDGSISQTRFKWQHDQTNFIGKCLWLAVQWEQ
tara:strand:+ start:439 stop:993 length:555 start_codon:yes stop_codon:yes gene_type:complete